MTAGLRIATLAEALTLLALVLVAVPLKHAANLPEATRVMGPVHGAAFLTFSWFVVRAWAEGLFGWRGAARMMAGAMIPFGGFANERWLKRRCCGKAI